MGELINGKQIADNLRHELKAQIDEFRKESGRSPGLAVILVGENFGSSIYVRNKAKGCEDVGIVSTIYRLPEQSTQGDVLSLVETLNNEPNVDGILIQLPLPKHIKESKVVGAISPLKDVDGLGIVSSGRLLHDKDCFFPCTPNGIIYMLKSIGCEMDGKNAVVVGRSNIVGKPVALLLLQNNATVTVCHSHTQNLKDITSKADILISAIGKAKFITKDMVKPGAVVIDVGISRDENGKAIGDVDFQNVKDVASFTTPVPGGVGPMTITMLLYNTLYGAKTYGKRV